MRRALELANFTIAEAAKLLQGKAVSPLELARASLARVLELNPKLNIYLTVMADSALEEARRAEREIQEGRYRGPLHGIPLSLKDLFYTKGVNTTAGSKILADFVPDHDATVTVRLKEAGAIIMGKAHMAEFAMGDGTGYNVHYGPCRNPWKLDHVSGGSSSGSAAAVAAGVDLGSLGSDTTGSIRIPAACCGVVGLKPTYGRVSRYGVVLNSLSLDHVGPITRTATDAALVLEAIAGYDPKDPFSAQAPVPHYSLALDGNIRRLRVGLPKEYFWDELDPEVEGAVRLAIAALDEMGCRVEEVSLPMLPEAAKVASLISLPEAAVFHEKWFHTRPQDYWVEVRKKLEKAEAELATQYVKAQQIRRQFIGELDAVLQRVDVLATPTLPIPAPKIPAEEGQVKGKDPEGRSELGKLTRPFSLSGHPAVSVPCGFTKEGLPVAFQLAGRYFEEATILKVAHAYQLVTDWHTRCPSL